MIYKSKLKGIRAFVFDVDGVFTNSEVLLHPDGDLLRVMNTRDGYAIKTAIDEGLKVCIISGGRSQAVRQRLLDLGVKDVYLGVSNKLEVFKEYIKDEAIDPATVLYMGDDIPDYDVMMHVGLPCAPKDAAEEILEIAEYVSSKKGGEGCVRDIVEQTLKVQGKWFKAK
ncbi:KdsC family phosphatase [Luteibaculum oceani]|uniref:3-deoxy-D-manno-octulosonate 8-phosphate phosphatase n=1 Tax=Luteibaculum oceani TaxID=1294296 RepID=A0A5C6UUK3_9FLAO|nr:HAD hydrolase family protein [Luteibaculum oceani]TXC77053.1 3-deoxy-D-manno-octulosonate 8-phosphate phosphatase [Luteibaculum oceani]